jgi:tetratricopeptide (TPR) repeat protein
MVAVRAGTRAPARRAAGTRVGPFRLERYLGGGRDTEVWRANGDGIVVAVKLRRAGVEDPLATARLAREATVLRHVRHPALIGLFDAGEDDGEPYLAFVFHDGPTVAECIDDGRLPMESAAATFAPVAEALAVLHRQSIVHRDVKPSNVLLTNDGPLLIDAGHASVAGTTYDGWVDAAPAIAGTTAYLGPEADVTVPAAPLDIYALGISLLEAVTGRASAAAAADAPAEIRDLLLACTADDPALRPSAPTVAAALRTLAGATVAPRGRRAAAPAHASGTVGPVDSVDSFIDLTAAEPTDAPVPRDHGSGRTNELARLTDSARDGVLGNELRAVLVTAPPGTGKSWLVDAAASRLERAGSRVLRAVCSPARGDVRVVASWLLDLGRDLDGVGELTRVAGPAPGAALLRAAGLARGGEADVDPAVVADAMATVLAHAAVGTGAGAAAVTSAEPNGEPHAHATMPIVCVVEDLHHASLELLDLLSRLAMRAGVPGGLWCTTRPNWVDADDLGFEVLALGPLDPDAISALVADAIGADPPPGADAASGADAIGVDAANAPSARDGGELHAYMTRITEVLAVAGGNPLHAREAALALQRGESLDARSSLPELIASRFASFEPPLRDALGLAAACGDDFWPEAMGGSFLDAVPELYRAGVAQARMSSTLAASTEAYFRHPLLREVAYASLDETRRRQLHGELGHALDHAGAPPEIVAGQAGTAFRLGDADAAPLAARAAADAGREALDRFSLQAVSEWIALLRETGAEAEPGLADLLDTELALDRGEYERAKQLVGPQPDHGSLATRRLVLATRAAYGVGELADAADYGERALALLADVPIEAAAHTLTYGVVLSRTGHHERALALLDRAAETARQEGASGLASRIAAEAAQVASDLVLARGGYFIDAIDRTRRALTEQRDAGDLRGYIASAPAFVETLYIDSPLEALALAIDAAEKSLELGDLASAARLAIAICDTALEAESVDALDRWLSALRSGPLDAMHQIEADVLMTTANAAQSLASPRIDRELMKLADQYLAMGDATRADTPHVGAVCSLEWTGRVKDARALFDHRVRKLLPTQLSALHELVLRALEGPPWRLAGLDTLETTTLHNYDRALLHLLRGEHPDADTLFRERYADRMRMTGSARQRFSPYFPGALISALGPDDTEPDIEWLLGWIHRPPFPGLWIVHRAICALLLSERADPPEAGLAETAIRLVDSTTTDDAVRRWIGERAEGSGTGLDRGE